MKDVFTKGLNIPKDWEDTFNNNDAMYSYEIGRFRIYIDYPNPEDSELYVEAYGHYDRFGICLSDAYRDENPDELYIDDVHYQTDDLEDAIAWMKSHPYGKNTGRDVNGNPIDASAKASHKRVEKAKAKREAEMKNYFYPIDKQAALEMATKYKFENPQTFHSVNYIAKKIYQHQTIEWFEKDYKK